MARHGENIRKRADGRWEARILTGYKENGKAQYKYLYGKSYREVKEKKNNFLKQEPAGRYQPPALSKTCSELLDEWLGFVYPHLKESTYSRYVFAVEKHLKPELGKIRLGNLTTEQIDHYIYQKLTCGKLNCDEGLSSKSVTDLLSIFKLAIEFGCERGFLPPNQFTIHHPRQTVPEIHVMDEAACRKLESYILCHKESPVCIGILLSLYTGLRIGKVCALHWEDINLDTQTLAVRRTLMRIQDPSPQSARKTKIIECTPKTASSVRRIPLPEWICPFLQQLQQSSQCYLLTGRITYMEPRNYYNRYKKILRSLNLDKYNYHALRHTFATRCVEHGFDVKSLSEILGHADVATTMRRYVHPSMEAKRKQMQMLQMHPVCSQNQGQRPTGTC